MRFVVEALHRRLLDRAVHSFDLPIRPGMLELGYAMLDPMLPAHTVKDVLEGVDVTGAVRELNAVIRENGVEPVRLDGDQIAKKLRRRHLPGLLD